MCSRLQIRASGDVGGTLRRLKGGQVPLPHPRSCGGCREGDARTTGGLDEVYGNARDVRRPDTRGRRVRQRRREATGRDRSRSGSRPRCRVRRVARRERAQGVELAIDQVNDEGGVLGGRRLSLAAEDNACNPTDGASSLTKLITKQRVSTVIGALCSGVTLSAMPLAKRHRVPFIVSTSTSPDITTASGKGGNEFTFRINPSDATLAARWPPTWHRPARSGSWRSWPRTAPTAVPVRRRSTRRSGRRVSG